jgi:A/G-specific adenine glycosylase
MWYNYPMERLNSRQIADFRDAVYGHYRRQGRHDLPWRRGADPYRVMVSELMLQQTQVPRVIPKFALFIELFPDIGSLARAPLRRVLAAWSGLGYNRRALYLKRAAEIISSEHGGRVPDSIDGLERLPGIGSNTAGAILAYAYDRPAVFVEANVRTAHLRHFSPGRRALSDRDLLPLVARTLDREHPRCWYSALMDYGTWLRQQAAEPPRGPSPRPKQGRFEGSNRQLRGAIIRLLTRRPLAAAELCSATGGSRPMILLNLGALEKDGLITSASGKYRIS